MGFVFDKEAAARYALWAQGPQGRAMERWVESCLPGLLRIQPGERALDIGCGHGTHLLFLKRLGLDICGVDASPHMITAARQRLGHTCELRTAQARDLPFEDNAFDLSVMINTLEFLEDPLEALREAGRVTRRAVFVGVMNSASWAGLARRLSVSPPPPPLDCCRYYNFWQLKGLLRSALGDVPVRWRSSWTPPPVTRRVCGMVSGSGLEPRIPLGAFLGLSAELVYRFKTDNLALKVPVRPRGRTIADGAAMGEGSRWRGARDHERSPSL
jgi:SAM-dependent methyltransferase